MTVFLFRDYLLNALMTN